MVTSDADRVGVRAEPICFLIADISGYTRYLAGVELDHAQDILADLLDTIVGALQPLFGLSRIEGDAAFMYSPVAAIDGSVLLDTVEGAYFGFQRRLRSISQATSCRCNACESIPTLDLKFAIHHGEAIRHQVAGHEELVGTDAIVVHRMLKNSVIESRGVTAYAFLTDACLAATSLDPLALGMQPHRETYDVGEVRGWVHDLAAAWLRAQQQSRVKVDEDDALWSASRFLPIAAAPLFELVTSPLLRPSWSPEPIDVREDSPTSRRGVGTTNHCVHGDSVLVERILDWRPPEYWTVEVGPPDGFPIVVTDAIEPTDGGSLIHTRVRARTPAETPPLAESLPLVGAVITGALDALAAHVAALTQAPAGEGQGEEAASGQPPVNG